MEKIKERLLSVCEYLGMDVDELRGAAEVKIINQILYFSLEDESFFWGDVTYEDIEKVLDAQYQESVLDEHNCFMFYESAMGGVHTYTPVEEMKERFLEAYNWVTEQRKKEECKRKKYCVTVTRTGCVFIEAENEEEAMYIADHVSTDTVSWSDDWSPTNCEEDESATGYITKPDFD